MSIEQSASQKLGNSIRAARNIRGWSIAELAEKIGRPREWLNRVELGYSEWGEHNPPSKPDLEALIAQLGGCFALPPVELHALRDKAEAEFAKYKVNARPKRAAAGKSIQAEIIMGEAELYKAAAGLVDEQHSDAVIRNTGIWGLAPSYLAKGDEWENYRKTLGRFLDKNPHGLLKRVEYVGTADHLKVSKEADKWLAGNRELKQVNNTKVRYIARNPLLLDVIIGQREALICIPQRTGYAGAVMGIIVRDKLFVEALRTWFDEVLWDHPAPKQDVDFDRFEQSFKDITAMYGFDSISQ